MRIVRPGPSFFSPIIGRIPLKSVNSFLFVFSRRCKNSTPAFPLAYKSTAAFASTLFTEHTAKAVVNWFQKFTRLHLFLLFLAYCCVRFLTLINNSSIFQRTFHGIIIPFQIHRGGLFLLFLSALFVNLLQSYKV